MTSRQSIYFIDIETVPQYENLEAVPEAVQELYRKKFEHEFDNKYEDLNNGEKVLVVDNAKNHYSKKAGFYAEFAKVVCVCVGKIHISEDDGEVLFMKKIVNRDETIVLKEFSETIQKASYLCAHNGKEFDFPFLFRRFIINGLPIPPTLNNIGKKPWDNVLEDTMEMWSSTQWKHRISLNLFAKILNLPSPKEDVSGDQVSGIYYSMFKDKEKLPFDAEKEAYDKISGYCAGDVFTLVNVYSKLVGMSTIKEDQIRIR